MSETQVVQSLQSPVGTDPIWSRTAATLTNKPMFKPAWQQRLLLCGWPGSGKTTFGLSIPKCLVIDTEGGTEELPMVHESTHRVRCRTWEEVDEVIKALEDDHKKNGTKRRFDTVCIDTVDALGGNQNSLIGEYLIRDNGADVIAAFGSNGSGWARLSEMFSRTFQRIEAASYGLVALTHLTRKQVTDHLGNTRTLITRDLTPRTDAIIRNRVAFVGVLGRGVETKVTKGTAKLPDGTEIETTTGTEDVIVHKMLFRSADAVENEMLKARVEIQAEIEFGQANGWKKFAAAYKKALPQTDGK